MPGRLPSRLTAALAAALLACATLAACGDGDDGGATSGDAADWVLGAWSGVLHQEGMDPFRVWAQVRSLRSAARNTVRYSGLDCRGTWAPLGGDGEAFRFREVITAGRSRTCKGAGIVTLRRDGDRIAYRFRGGGVESRGVLSEDPQAGSGGEPERDAMAQSGTVAGAPGRELVLSRVTVPPGAALPLHRHRGTQVARVESGTLTYTVREGEVTVRRGQSDSSPRVVRTIAAGTTAPIRAGEWIVEQPSAIHRAENRGSEPVVIYLATLLEAGAPPATPVSR